MREIEKVLNKNEKVLWEGSPNFWPFVAKSFLIAPFGLVFFSFAVFFTINALQMSSVFPVFGMSSTITVIFGSIFALAGISMIFGPPLYAITVHKHTHYAITDKRVLLQKGIIGRDFEIVDFDKITNVEVNVGLFDKILSESSGSILMSTAGSMATYARSGNVMIIPQTLYSVKQPYDVFKFFKKVSHDVKTDMYFPNKYRPNVNLGYKTKYNSKM